MILVMDLEIRYVRVQSFLTGNVKVKAYLQNHSHVCVCEICIVVHEKIQCCNIIIKLNSISKTTTSS